MPENAALLLPIHIKGTALHGTAQHSTAKRGTHSTIYTEKEAVCQQLLPACCRTGYNNTPAAADAASAAAVEADTCLLGCAIINLHNTADA
jgi:hypothetical protein